MKLLLGLALIATAVFGTTHPARAATFGAIHGTVTDAASRRPLAGATVTIASPSGRYRASTDAHGFYSIVGVLPDSYTLTVARVGFSTAAERGVTISQDTDVAIDVALSRSLKVIGAVKARSASFPVQPSQPTDVYVVGNREQAQLGGMPNFENEGELLNSLPGVTPVSGAAGGGLLGNGTAIRGGLANQIGYQLDGIDATEPLTNYFINNLIINGARSIDVTAGPGDASKGGAGSGYVNIVTKTGTYPSSGFVQFDDGGPAFEHNMKFEYGTATPSKNLSLFVSGRYGRDFGGGPPYGNVYGDWKSAYPDTVGQVQFETTNDTVANGLIHFGKNAANTIQLWGEWGANREVGGYGIDPLTYPFYTGNPAYASIYAQAPLLLQTQEQRFGIPVLYTNLQALTGAQVDALMPFFPGQHAVDQTIGTVPNETTTYNLFKIAYARDLNANAYLNARIYRTQNWVVDDFNDPDNSLFGYGLPALGFQDIYTTRATQNTGFAADLQQVIGRRNVATFGLDYRFSRANLQGFVVSPTLFFAGPTMADFLPVDPYLPAQPNGSGTPGRFFGMRYPAFNEVIDNDMYRTALYGNDDWTLNDRTLLQLGLRYEKQLVPTSQGSYEANAIDPRVYGTWTLGRHRNTVLRAGYGHAATFAPLFQLVAQYNPPAFFKTQPATLAICGGPRADFHAPCANYYDELVNAWWNGYGVDPVSFSRPQQSDSYEVSLEHAFGRFTGIKLTFFDRRDYGVIVNSQHVTISAQSGAVIPGTISVTNQGTAQTAGLELQLSRQIAQGLSGQLNVSYTNQFVNYVTSNAFRPSVQPALLASGAVFHPPYLSPLYATAALDYHHNGWQINPIWRYVGGYPIGIWSYEPVYVGGKALWIPNTNLFGTTTSQYCYYVDPQAPGTPQQPHVVGSTGGACSPNLNGLLSHPAVFIDLVISRRIDKRVTLGLEIQNVLGNDANYPYYNPGYVNNGYGAFGPGSGANPVAGLPGTVRAYPPGPYFTIPSGTGRQFTFYSRFTL